MADDLVIYWPFANPASVRVSQKYGGDHHGVDYAIVTGTPILAGIAGKAVYAGWSTAGYGFLVIIQFGVYKVYYAHLSEIRVKVGDVVSVGQVIGLSGSTGNSTGPHLHLELRRNNAAINPGPYMAAMGSAPAPEPTPEPTPTPPPVEDVFIPFIPVLPRARVLPAVINLRSTSIVSPTTDIGDLYRGEQVEVIEVRRDGADVWLRIGYDQWAAMLYNGQRLMEWCA